MRADPSPSGGCGRHGAGPRWGSAGTQEFGMSDQPPAWGPPGHEPAPNVPPLQPLQYGVLRAPTRSNWPTPLGVIAIVYAGLAILYGGYNAIMSFVMPRMMASMQSNMPTGT